MTILVIGGAGFIGSHTVDRLRSLGHEVRILDSLAKPVHRGGRKPEYVPAEVEFIKGDVREKKVLRRALSGVNAVYHFASYQDNLFDYSRYFDVNASGTARLYEVIRESNFDIKKVIVASSQAVIGEGAYRCGKDGLVFPMMRTRYQLRRERWEVSCPKCSGKVRLVPADESIANPQSQYGMSKYAGEMIALNLGKQLGIATVALRYSIVQGARQSFYNPYSGACRQFSLALFLGEQAEIFEDGRQIRDFVNIEDVVEANILVLRDRRANGQVFNVGGGRGYSLLEFYEIARREFGSSLQPKIAGNFRLGDTRHALSAVTKLGKLGWRPKNTPAKSVHDYRIWLSSRGNVSKALLRRHEKLRKAIVES